MQFSQSHPVRTLRRFVLVGALVTAAASTAAVPQSAHAAPAGVGMSARRADADPVAAQAAQALTTLRRGLVSHDASTMKSFDATRDRIAGEIAARLMIDPAVMQAAWQRADHEHQHAILSALTQLGVPYRRHTSVAGEGFDCSGLTAYAWGQVGFLLHRQSSAQIGAAARRDQATAQAGDLVHYPGHVMIWLGVDRAVVHAPYSGRNVEVDSVNARRSLRWGDPTG